MRLVTHGGKLVLTLLPALRPRHAYDYDPALHRHSLCRPVLDAGARAAAALRDASAFRWVDLGSMFGKLAAPTAAAH